MEDSLLALSLNSSFVPIDKNVVLDAVQVIDEDKQFNQDLLGYIENTSPIGTIGNNYHIISVFGSQSTGKSTLLNKLFNTNFDVMDETRRQQTTKGIWLAYSPAVNTTSKNHHKRVENIFVMDVEGTDGRERGEDQDFERKAALFALATSEVLIINIWETQIGLYQGANMGLLKTVFEVNLSLFGKNKLNNKDDDHKVLLLFVIRDHIGVTPVENLAETVSTDLIKMWDDLNKPKHLEAFKFEDFFDIKFHALAHKVLQADKFSDDVKLLGDKFIDSEHEQFYWDPKYHHNIPIDGWTMYANNCWEQIGSNKDLDLPTQQILVAKFKCDEIVHNLYQEFTEKFNALLLNKVPSVVNDSVEFKEIGLLMLDLKADYTEQFHLLASKYNPLVYEQKKQLLQEKIVLNYKELFDSYAKKFTSFLIKNFKIDLEVGTNSGETFTTRVEQLKKGTLLKYHTSLALISSGEVEDSTISEELDELVAKQQVIELNGVITKALKKVTSQLGKFIKFEVNDINDKSWDNIENKFHSLVKDIDFNGLGLDEEAVEFQSQKFQFKAWVKFYGLIKKNLSKESILNILKDRFDEKFRYDDNGVPKLYSNDFELDTSFNAAKSSALDILPKLTIISKSDSSEIIPEFDIFSVELRKQYDEPLNEDDDEDEDDDANKFSHIIGEGEKAEILSKFKKEVDARYVETKRSIVQLITAIPYYIYLVIVVLGWNEFLAVIRSPFFFTLLLLLGGITYVMYQLNLIRPALQVGQKLVEESVQVGKAKLREFLNEGEVHGGNLRKVSGQPEEIEMDDLE